MKKSADKKPYRLETRFRFEDWSVSGNATQEELMTLKGALAALKLNRRPGYNYHRRPYRLKNPAGRVLKY